eukprot:3348748-Alexandrium_andersonii.AAC.1
MASEIAAATQDVVNFLLAAHFERSVPDWKKEYHNVGRWGKAPTPGVTKYIEKTTALVELLRETLACATFKP